MFFIHMDFMVNTYGGNLNVQEKLLQSIPLVDIHPVLCYSQERIFHLKCFSVFRCGGDCD